MLFLTPTNSVKALKAICLGSRGTGKASGWHTCSNYSQRFSWMTQPGLGWLQKRRWVKWKPNLCVSFHWIVCKEDKILILHVEVLSVISLWISCEYMPPACCRILVTCIRSVRSFTTRWPCLRTRWKKRVKRNGESHGSSGWRHSAGGAVVTRTAWKATDIRYIQTRAGSRSWWLYVPSCWLASFFFQAFWKRTFGDKWHRFLRAGCPSCHPTNSVILKETQSTDPNSGLASFFLHPWQDSWWRRSCFLLLAVWCQYDDIYTSCNCIGIKFGQELTSETDGRSVPQCCHDCLWRALRKLST